MRSLHLPESFLTQRTASTRAGEKQLRVTQGGTRTPTEKESNVAEDQEMLTGQKSGKSPCLGYIGFMRMMRQGRDQSTDERSDETLLAEKTTWQTPPRTHTYTRTYI